MDKKTLEKLAELSRIKIDAKKEDKILADLGKILDYFEELKEAPTAGILPMNGGTEAVNVCRDDELVASEASADDLVNQFREKEKGLLKVPGVFE